MATPASLQNGLPGPLAPEEIFTRPAWTGWIAAASDRGELRATFTRLAAQLCLSPEQLPLFELFTQKLLHGFVAAEAPDPGDGWDMGKSAALDRLIRLEIAAGRFLGAIEDARETLARLYAVLDSHQRQTVDAALTSASR
jgi:hypothetical protein